MRYENLVGKAERVVAAFQKESMGMLWLYTDEEGKEFYLPEKKTGTIRSPYTGKSFTAKPERRSLSEVGKEIKDETKELKRQLQDWIPKKEKKDKDSKEEK